MNSRKIFVISLCSLALVASRGVADSSSGAVDVSQFGAKGDTQHDDTQALQKAFDSLRAKGGALIFPEGTYRVRAPLKLFVAEGTRVSLQGQGGGATLAADMLPSAQASEPSSPSALVTIQGASSGTLLMQGLTILGQNNADERGIDGLLVDALQHIQLNGVRVNGAARYGLVISRVNSGELENCRAENNHLAGLAISASRHLTIQSGFYLSNGSTLPPGGAGIVLLPSSEGPNEKIVLLKNEIRNTQGPGILIQNGESITVAATKIDGFRDAGVYAVSASTSDVLQNIAISENELRTKERVPNAILIMNTEHTATGSVRRNRLVGSFEQPIVADQAVEHSGNRTVL